jgi:hypothetical protein
MNGQQIKEACDEDSTMLQHFIFLGDSDGPCAGSEFTVEGRSAKTRRSEFFLGSP